jgi:ferredoxin
MGEIEERTIAGLRVVIERDVCIGSANCTKIAPEVFVLDAQQIITFQPDAATADVDRDRLLEACDVCPVDALSAFDAAGRRLVP